MQQGKALNCYFAKLLLCLHVYVYACVHMPGWYYKRYFLLWTIGKTSVEVTEGVGVMATYISSPDVTARKGLLPSC